MILIIGVCVLMFLSFFSKSLFWLKDGLYFCFGKLLYIIPFVIIILMLVISFAEINIELVKRLIASVLLLFAVSGIVSIATGNVDDGGLLGRGPVMKLRTQSPAKMVNRGGRIPAPLQSLRN